LVRLDRTGTLYGNSLAAGTLGYLLATNHSKFYRGSYCKGLKKRLRLHG
jgi:hypothetical protein